VRHRHHHSTVHGPIQDPNAARILNKHGIHGDPQQLITWRQMRHVLESSIKELEKEHRKEHIIDQALLVARITKATCDAFLGMVTAVAGVFKLGGGAKVVTGVYEATTPLAGAASTWAAGGRVDLVKTVASSAKGGSSLAGDDYELLIKTTAVKAEILNAAIRSEPKEILPAARDYVIDAHLTIANMEKMPEWSKRFGAFAEVTKRAVEYNKSLGEAFDQMLENKEEGDQRYRELKASLLKQAIMVNHKIAELERHLHTYRAQSRPRLP